MKRLALCLLVLFCSSCGFRGFSFSSDKSSEAKGTRNFKIDDSKSALILSLTGVHMGTPDGEVVSSLLEMAEADGTIKKSTELGQAIEGGLIVCLELPNANQRQELLNRLQRVQTNPHESNYSLESVAACPKSADRAVSSE